MYFRSKELVQNAWNVLRLRPSKNQVACFQNPRVHSLTTAHLSDYISSWGLVKGSLYCTILSFDKSADKGIFCYCCNDTSS